MPAGWKRMADRAAGILLDTSAVIAHLRGRIDIRALTVPGEPIFLPLTALGELYKGAEKKRQSPEGARQRRAMAPPLQGLDCLLS